MKCLGGGGLLKNEIHTRFDFKCLCQKCTKTHYYEIKWHINILNSFFFHLKQVYGCIIYSNILLILTNETVTPTQYQNIFIRK